MILLLSAPAYSQNGQFPMRHFTTDDGLPSNTVYDIYKDSKGFLWFCTDKGVARYNGIKFESFTTFNGLPDNEIFFAKEDLYGRIWFATFNGALCYFKSETFHTAENTGWLKIPYKTSFITSIIVEDDSSVTITYYDHKVIVNVVKDSCHLLNIQSLFEAASWRPSGSKQGVNILCAFKERRGQYALICQGKKIVHINDSARVLYYSARRDSIFLAIFSDKKNYFIAEKAIYEGRNPKMIKTFDVKRGNYNVLHRVVSLNGYFYRGTDSGLFINPAGQFRLNEGNRVLDGANISAIATDGMRNVWIGSLNEGAYAMPIDFDAYHIIGGISPAKVLYAATVKNAVFFATMSDDLFVFENNKKRSIFSYDHQIKKTHLYNDQPGFLIDENLTFYNFYNQDNVVVNNLLSAPSRLTMYRNPSMSTGIKYLFVNGPLVYLQARRNLAVLDYRRLKPGDNVVPSYNSLVSSDSLNSDRIFCVAQDKNKDIWYSTVNDMHRVVGYKSIVQPQFRSVALKKFIFFRDRIVGYTHDNKLLICSNYLSATPHVDTFSPDNCIWENFYVLDSLHLLISTNNLYRLLTFSNEHKDVKVTAIEDEYIPVKADAICVDSTNCYFFQGRDITAIRKIKLFFSSPPPKLIFTVASAAGHTFSLNNGRELTFSYADARSVSVGFASISYIGKSLIYQYAIDKEGVTTWNAIQDDQINLTNPTYGAYTIKIRARSLGGEWSTPISCVIRILHPFWATWWFIGCVVLLVGAIIVYFVRLRINTIVKAKARENENKVRYLKSEYKALNALMNPHFIFNTLNNVQGLVNRDDKRAANEYLRIFADLVRQNMHNVSMEMISLEKEMDLVKNYLLLEKLRFKENLHYEITVDENIDTSEIMVPPLLIQPLVENAIKHGILPLESSSGIVRVNISENDSVLQIRVADNGVGLNSKEYKKDSAHISFGLDNIKRRIEQLSAILEKNLIFEMKEEIVEDQRWTVALISIPV
jgi:two-component sensor histidine kinase